jgi:hypothetical protein
MFDYWEGNPTALVAHTMESRVSGGPGQYSRHLTREGEQAPDEAYHTAHRFRENVVFIDCE